MHQDAWEAYTINEDKDKWIHSKSLELIERGFDSDEAYILACKLYDEKKNK